MSVITLFRPEYFCRVSILFYTIRIDFQLYYKAGYIEVTDYDNSNIVSGSLVI